MSFIDLSNDKDIIVRVELKTIQGDTGSELKNLCKKRLDEKMRDIHLDFAAVKYMDSSSIGALLYLIQFLKKDGYKIYLDKASEEVRQLFKSLILDQFLVM
ncbi:MAG: STAS domain-containing protein [Spirochaetia bacterium]|nr:STAS domain-containing protein [Spirochaetia bacterium]